MAEVESFPDYWDRVGWKGNWFSVDDRVNGFYVPMLARAARYDRMAGYFTSSALSLAAAGLSRFIAGGGAMRLIVGSQLDEEDIAAIERGQPLDEAVRHRLLDSDAFDEATGPTAEHRRQVLGWMVKAGRLQIKVGIPVDPSTRRPLRPHEASSYFHSKYGIFVDHAKPPNQVAFIGSDNETWKGWVGNHETFSTFQTWVDPVWDNNGVSLVAAFDAHWDHRPDEGWAVLDLDDAVRQKLVSWCHGDMPPAERDPEEKQEITPAPVGAGPVDPRLVELAGAPRSDGGTFVGLVTASVEALPHQTALVRRVVESWPRGYLLADEVGLGKTIEAGFIIRELLLSGKAERFLLLVPASVLRQWQEELSEKLNLRVNRYEAGEFYDPDNNAVSFRGPLWSAFPIVLASSHLARRSDRRNEVLSSGPWDVVLLDEAHHARRKGKELNATPNAMLRLVDDIVDRKLCKALLLASATPMQMYPREAWDLVRLFGLPGAWGNSPASFVRYFEQLRLDYPDRDWAFLSKMAVDSTKDSDARPDPEVEEEVSALGFAATHHVRRAATHGVTSAQAKALPAAQREVLDLWLLHNNPMRERVFRSTRETMRAYQQAGLLDRSIVIPERIVNDAFLQMTPEEFELYGRIRTYIKRTYNRYLAGTQEQKALGFIMTVYRRRLTSSFKAIELSLERRANALADRRLARDMFDEDDQEADPTLFALDTELSVADLEGEVAELRRFIADLKALPPDETKMLHLHQLLETAFRSRGHNTILVFTQYTDTMNHIVDQLRTQYGHSVMSYSGAGGRRLDPATNEYVEVSKVETKRLFREGEDVKILVGTDSLSEGLNLQTCARLVNFDMPWNFMRVEQRIGRIDRIDGQPRVEVTNLFYKDTIEEQIYRGIAESHGGFTWIVGPAQPVLADIERRIREHELGPEVFDEDGEPEAGHLVFVEAPNPVAQIIADVEKDLEAAEGQPVSLASFDKLEPDQSALDLHPAMTLEGIEEIVLAVQATRSQLYEHPAIDDAWLIDDAGGNKVAVTFRRGVVADFSPEVRLLTYGDPLFDLLLTRAGVGSLAAAEEPVSAEPILTIAEQIGQFPFGYTL